MTLRTASLPVKVLFTCFLLSIGIGYLMAVLYLFLIEIEPHSKDGTGMVQAVIIKYYGQRGVTRLEGTLEGSMGENLTPAQKKKSWHGSGREQPKPILPRYRKFSSISAPPATARNRECPSRR
ncbi:MAG: hypothetical protein MPW14_19900 [Candidatus Manganitrophus sp.]|nr:hypothetical protein [Candidatus Manganitrophus sp.]MDC4225561.1 hypothetical protein [Candidatus Manganitrophus sp.]WDT73082.1 MAG: hypothetical protein MPW17_09640 [Candidatus Manganitrophus sp.]WDT74708.1 MAG: hypothetical protein MPW16_15765 [Candidatus Manganitrophus sp.]WDT79385.1 MAG: hypothetical protein MPW14_19900 [Candidatus Manganitrophus sp.]